MNSESYSSRPITLPHPEHGFYLQRLTRDRKLQIPFLPMPGLYRFKIQLIVLVIEGEWEQEALTREIMKEVSFDIVSAADTHILHLGGGAGPCAIADVRLPGMVNFYLPTGPGYRDTIQRIATGKPSIAISGPLPGIKGRDKYSIKAIARTYGR